MVKETLDTGGDWEERANRAPELDAETRMKLHEASQKQTAEERMAAVSEIGREKLHARTAVDGDGIHTVDNDGTVIDIPYKDATEKEAPATGKEVPAVGSGADDTGIAAMQQTLADAREEQKQDYQEVHEANRRQRKPEWLDADQSSSELIERVKKSQVDYSSLENLTSEEKAFFDNLNEIRAQQAIELYEDLEKSKQRPRPPWGKSNSDSGE